MKKEIKLSLSEAMYNTLVDSLKSYEKYLEHQEHFAPEISKLKERIIILIEEILDEGKWQREKDNDDDDS